MKIYFIRHGETVWNTLKLFQGSSNSPLTEKGKSQAIKLGQKLNNVNFDVFYSSPMGRTIETTNLVLNGRNIPIKYIDEFKEISMGDMEGIKREIFEEKFPKQFNNLFFNPEEYSPKGYGGEDYNQLLARVQKGLEKIVNENSSTSTIAVVSHGVTLKVIFKIIKNLTFKELGEFPVPKNTSLSIVDYDYDNKTYNIELFSDTSHLDGSE